MLIRFATRVGCGDLWSFNGSKHGVWLMRQDFPGALWPAGIKTMLKTMLRIPEALGVSRPAPQRAAPPPRPVVSCLGGVGESTSSDERIEVRCLKARCRI